MKMMGALDCVGVNRITPTVSTEVFTVKTASSYNLNEPSRDLESQSNTESSSSGYHVCWKLGVDLPIFIMLFALVGLFELGVIPGRKSGFYCNDPALSFPYTGDTVTSGILISTLFLTPIVFFFITETIFAQDTSRTRLVQALRNSSWLYSAYLYGMIMNLAVVEVMKGIVGGPRPTFFDLCEPDTAKTCNGTQFVRTFECTSTKYSSWMQMDSYRSFPSGHTSMSVYYALFVAWYLQKRAFNWRHRSILLVPVLQLLTVSFSVVSSLTRITDRRHHWWDVLTGVGVAAITLLYAVTFLCDNFSYANCENEDENAESRKTTKTYLYDERRVIVNNENALSYITRIEKLP